MRAVVLMREFWSRPASWREMSHEMVSILAQLSPVGQQRRVVPAARERHVRPVGQQKLAGELGHLSKFSRQVLSCCRAKRRDGGRVEAVAAEARRARRSVIARGKDGNGGILGVRRIPRVRPSRMCWLSTDICRLDRLSERQTRCGPFRGV